MLMRVFDCQLDCVHFFLNHERRLDSLLVACSSPKTAYTFCEHALENEATPAPEQPYGDIED